MKVLLFDPCAGASGDMIMASLLDLGADPDAVRRAVESVGCTLEVSRQEKSHIMASQASVISERRYPIPGRGDIHSAGFQPAGKGPEKCTFCPEHSGRSGKPGARRGKGAGAFSRDGGPGCAGGYRRLLRGACGASYVESVFSRPVSVGGGYVQTVARPSSRSRSGGAGDLEVSQNALAGRPGARGAAHAHRRGPAGNSGR